MTNKKSQIPGQIFIYLIALIIIGGIIGYGYYAISKLKGRADQISALDFKNKVEAAVKSSSLYGNVKIEEFILPNKVQEVCFINIGYTAPQQLAICDTDNTTEFRPIVCDAWKSNSQTNVFLLPPTETSILVNKITVDGNGNNNEDTQESCNAGKCHYLCFQAAANRIKVRMEGKGTHTFIRRP